MNTEKKHNGQFNQKRKMALTITVNGIRYHLVVNPMDNLMDLLCDRLLLFRTMEPCGSGQCQACTILLDGQVIKSCLLLAHQLNKKAITIIEDIDRDGTEILAIRPCHLQKEEDWKAAK